MSSLQILKDAVLAGNAKEPNTRENFLRKILQKSSDNLRLDAIENGDTDLTAICDCRCLSRIRKMAAINSNETSDQISFQRFSDTILGVQNAHTSRRRVAARRRR